MSFLKRKSVMVVAVAILVLLVGSYIYVALQPAPQELSREQAEQEFAAKQKAFQETLTYATNLSPTMLGYPYIPKANWVAVKETYETLVMYVGSSLDYKPGLAVRWEVSPDGKVFTFYLRKNVTFYPSGDPFNAQAVKFSLDHIFTGPSFIPVYVFGDPSWLQYDRTEIVDDYTVKVYFNRSLAWLMRVFAYSNTGAIVNPKFINAHGGLPKTEQEIDPYLAAHQDVTGPYVVDEYKPQDRIILKRNPTWWGWNSSLANRPERVVIRIIPETTTRMMMVARGDLDITYVEVAYMAELKKRIASENLPLIIDDSPSLVLTNPVLDQRNPPTNDVHIRRMLAWSFDYESWMEKIAFGFADRMISFPPKGSGWGYVSDVPYYTFNLEKAKEELALAAPENRAMVEKGIEADYYAGYAASLGKEGFLMWKSDLAKIGVNLIVNEISWERYGTLRKEGGVPILDRGWTPDFADPATFYAFLMPSVREAKAFGTTPQWIATLLEQAAFETNQDQRSKIYRQVEEWAYDQVPYVKIASKTVGGEYNVRGTWLKGFHPSIVYLQKPLFWELWKELPREEGSFSATSRLPLIAVWTTRTAETDTYGMITRSR
jgi:ABC-type transport system substrate-binding protein